jgi:hypothetical protein
VRLPYSSFSVFNFFQKFPRLLPTQVLSVVGLEYFCYDFLVLLLQIPKFEASRLFFPRLVDAADEGVLDLGRLVPELFMAFGALTEEASEVVEGEDGALFVGFATTAGAVLLGTGKSDGVRGLAQMRLMELPVVLRSFVLAARRVLSMASKS